MAGGVCREGVILYSSSSCFDHDGKQSHSELLSCKEATGNGYEEEEEEEEEKKSCLLPVQESSYCRGSILYRSGLGSYDPLRWPIRPLFPHTVASSVLQVALYFFGLSFLQLSALILRRSPANRILFALRQDKHCPCVTPKTFHRLSHFQHGSDISIIGFFLLLKCSEETMRMKRKNE